MTSNPYRPTSIAQIFDLSPPKTRRATAGCPWRAGAFHPLPAASHAARLGAAAVVRPVRRRPPGMRWTPGASAHPQRRQVAPRRAVSASCHRAGAPGAPVLRHRRSPPAGRTAAGESRAGLTRCDGGKSHPPKGTTQPHQCKGQRGGKGTFFLVRALWVRLGIRLQQVMPAIPPCAGTRSQPAGRHIVPLRCCILLLYKARERWAQDFEFIYLTWGGAKGIRTLDLLHAISRQHIRSRPSPQVTVPGSARPSRQVRTGCCTFALYRPACPVRPPNERLTSQNHQKTLPRRFPGKPASDRAT